MKTNEELFLSGDIETLYTKNIPFMVYMTQRYSNLPLEKEDLLSCGNLAFTKAIRAFSPHKSKWLTFFSKVMINEMLIESRKIKKEPTKVSLDTPIHQTSKETTLYLKDVLKEPTETSQIALKNLEYNEIAKLIKTLPPKERKAIILYLMGKKQKYIAKELGKTQSYTSRLIRKAKETLKKSYKRGVS